MEVVTTLGPVLEVPEGAIRLVVVVLLAGLPVAVVLAWMFDVTPDGVRAEADPGGHPSYTEDPVPYRSTTVETALQRPPPSAASQVIGRDREIDEIVGLLQNGGRLVTVTGPGGTGKTTLAAEVARTVSGHFPEGLVFFPLAAVPGPKEVVSSLALFLDVADIEGREPIDGLSKMFVSRRMLLVLDNFEHVLDAAPMVSELLARCPGLQVLATSRAPLRIGGEQEYALAPLGLPREEAAALDEILGSAAVELFVSRARQARPAFRLDGANAAAVAAVCRRLDGLPLALELAAARIRVLEPAALLERLEDALDVLTSGARDLPERQRTLRATIDWSHSLLVEAEQRLFRRLSVFSGGWTQEAAEAICDPDGEGDVLDEMASLVEKGLVSRDATGRFTMLRTILDFAREQLRSAGEVERFSRRHADHFRSFAERLEMGIEEEAARQLQWMTGAIREDGNLDAALVWHRAAAARGEAAAVEAGLAMCGSLMLYWHIRAQHVRMLEAVDALLVHREEVGFSAGWASAMNARGMAAMSIGDLETAVRDGTAALEAVEALGLERESAFFLWVLGMYYMMAGDFDEADQRIAQGVERSRSMEWSWGTGLASAFHGMLATAQGRTDAARERLERALEHLDDFEGRGVALSGLAMLTVVEGSPKQAMLLYEEARASFSAIGDRPEVARVLDEMAWCALNGNQTERARSMFLASLTEHDAIGSARGVGLALMGLAAVEVAEGRVERGLVVSAAAEAFSEEEGVVVSYPWVFAARERMDAAIAGLPEDTVDRLTRQGRGLSAAEAMAFIGEPGAAVAA